MLRREHWISFAAMLGTVHGAAYARKAPEDVYNRTFNRDNFHLQAKEDLPEQTSLFREVFATPLSILRQVQNNQNGSNRALLDMQQRVPSMNDSDYQMRHAALEFDTDYRTRTNGREIAAHLEKEGVKVVSGMITNRIQLYQQFNEGLSFRLNLASLFARNNDAATTAAPPTPKDTVRYGLVLKGIEYSEAPIAIAALTSMENAMPFATASRPIWGIEEVTSHRQRRPFHANVPAPPSYLQRPVLADGQVLEIDDYDKTYLDHHIPVDERSLWSRVSLPAIEFDGKVRPRTASDLTDLAGGNSGLPGMQVQLNQVQGYYSLSYLTNSQMRKERITHQVAVPVHGNLVVKRIYDEDFEEVETIAENILISPTLPAITIRQLHTNDSYRAGLRHSVRGHSFTVSAETPAGWRTSSGWFKNEGERYRADYSFRF